MRSLFDRIGGFAQVRKIVSAFYTKVLDSDRLAPYFEHTDLRRLIDHQTKFISQVLGGPASYGLEHLARAHAPLQILPDHFEEVADLLRETLEDFDLDPADVERLDHQVRSLRPHIVAAEMASAR